MRLLGASRVLPFTLAILLSGSGAVFAQKGGGGGAPASTPSAGTGTSPTNTTTTAPTNPISPLPSTSNRQPNGPLRPIFLSGRVVTDDGSPIDTNARVERICGATVHLEGHLDSKGHFGFEIGNEGLVDVDASTGYSAVGPNARSSALGSGLTPASAETSGLDQNGLMGCELRVTVPGYHSDVIELSMRKTMDNPDVGTIVLHHIGKIDGTTTSVTTLNAPKQAKKLYEKGMQLVRRGDLDEAAKHFSQATSLDPQYAVAWEAEGEIASKQGQFDQARTDFESAIKADSHYVNPYEKLGYVFAHQQKWQEAADTSQRGISLDPVEYPGLFWCNALANYNLKRHADAEKSVTALLKLDTQHHYPEGEKMMGELLLEKGDVADAATHIKTYLTVAPKAPDAEQMRKWLEKSSKRRLHLPPRLRKRHNSNQT